ADCTQTINVQDAAAPSITCPAAVNASCASEVPAPDTTVVTASDNCGGDPVVTFVNDTMSASNCFNQFVITRTYRATDLCGNHADCTQTITVQDITAPSITCPATVNVTCASGVPAPDIALVTASDGCGPVTVTWLSDTMSASNCPNRFLITRIYRATDLCGN